MPGGAPPHLAATGLARSFAFATVALVYVTDALGLRGDLLSNLATAVLLGFGLLLPAPPPDDRRRPHARVPVRARGRDAAAAIEQNGIE